MGRSREITGLVASIVTLLAMGVALAQDATWKDCALAARDPDRSIAACSKLLKRPSSRAHAAAFHHRGQAFAAKGNLDKAISDISAGIRLDPEPAYRWQERGELYARQGKYQQAIADITEAIRRDPTPRAFRFHSRAQAYQSLGDLTRAIADFDEAIRLDTEARSFRFYARANALRDAGRYDRALADYETTLKLAPTNAWVLVDRGRTYARMGRPEAARNDFDSALRLDPANEQKLRPVIEAEVAALPGQISPSTVAPSQESPPSPMHRAEQKTPSPPSSNSTPPGQPGEGEFARLLKIPAACQTARELGISDKLGVGAAPNPGPTCLAAQRCLDALKSQAAAGVEYLTRNPAVSDALSQLWTPPLSEAPAARIRRLLATERDYTSYPERSRCAFAWSSLYQNWFPVTEDGRSRNYTFLQFSTAGQALLEKVRAAYRADESEYQQLLAFNDRYSGLERLERARTTYQQAFKNDDVAAMINARSAMLQGLEQARGRKQLLTQQSAQLVQNEHALADFVTAIDREGLTSFVGQQTQTAIGEVRSELARLSQMAPGKRGDISARLEDFARRIRDIDSAIGSARSMKTQAEQTRQMLVESGRAARRVLDAAASEELKGAFDEEFRNSTNELITHFSDLASNDLSVIRQKQEEIDTARGKLTVLENQIADARVRYDRAKKLDGLRQGVMLKIAGALSELARPEIQAKLGNDGPAVVASLRSYRDTLSGFDSIRLINRIDYSDTLAAADDALAKVQQFKDEIVQVAQVVNDLQELNNRIDRRGRQLLDGPTSSMVADTAKSASTLSSAKIPLSSEARLQLSNTRVALNRLPDVVDNVMDREEKRILRREMPSRKGAWKFSFDVDKMTDEERVQASAQIESSQARYDLTVTCGRRGGELVIATFHPRGTDSKGIPWNFHGPKPEKDIRLRIDSNAAFRARLEGRGYVNQGQVMPADSAQFKNLLHSSRLVFADIFPEEQVEVTTAFPAQFSRLCELMGG